MPDSIAAGPSPASAIYQVPPTTDRAKQTIFDILSNRLNFDGIEVLDLFAGSGSLGLEAISRGAKSAVFVDKATQSLRVLEANIDTLGLTDQCTAYSADVFWFLKSISRSFDLVFVDPPYRLERIEELPNAIFDSRAVKEGALVVMEHSKESQIQLSDSMYDITRKAFGQTTVLILKTKQKPSGISQQ